MATEMNVTMITYILGGIGLFLLGMILMTDGLKSLAGNTLKTVLRRFTGGRLSSIMSGTCVTAIIQSSHATTIATIGFVSAGLVSFENSIGVIFGANLGTTSTGWIVSLLGLKLKIGTIAMPFIGVGALLRLLGRQKIAYAGLAIAGFGLIFVGIDMLQAGMKNLSEFIDLSSFAGTGVFNQIILIGIGILMTVIMQSSSAAVATTLTALNTGTITLEIAAVLVIGQNIGTTITAAIAGIGASDQAKRTAIAHILFNVITAVIAFVLLPVLLSLIVSVVQYIGITDKTIILAAFHTSFNVLGVIVFIPFTGLFARLIAKLLPEKGPRLTRNLDRSTIKFPAVAIETARRTVIEITQAVIDLVSEIIVSKTMPVESREKLKEIGDALLETRSFLSPIVAEGEVSEEINRNFISMMHAVDHVNQLVIASWEFEKLNVIHNFKQLSDLAIIIAENVEAISVHMKGIEKRNSIDDLQKASEYMKHLRKKQREIILEKTAKGEVDPDTAMNQIEALRWLDRVTYRIWRALYYLEYHNTQEGEVKNK